MIDIDPGQTAAAREEFKLREEHLPAINSMTEYPSIPTYHALGPRGALLEERVAFGGAGTPVVLTEKVDGANARIIALPDGSYLIGSRKELLYAEGDIVANPAQGIVSTLRPVADRLSATAQWTDSIVVYYFEVYGGKVGKAAKEYTRNEQYGYRLFDIVQIGYYANYLTWPKADLASWRDNGGQEFYHEGSLTSEASALGVELTPRLAVLDAADLPSTVEEMGDFLAVRIPVTGVPIGGSKPGRAEGLVLRTLDRSIVAKARFGDYARTGGKR